MTVKGRLTTPHLNEEKQTLSRRNALKTLAAVTGAVTLASLPSKWQTPVVQVGALPAHAQCSIEPGTFTIYIINNTPEPYSLRIRNGGYDNTVRASANGGTACMVGIPVEVELTITETLCGKTFTGRVPGFPEEFAGELREIEFPPDFCNLFNETGLSDLFNR